MPVSASSLANLANLSPYALARMADVASPNSVGSPGAAFLARVRNALVEHLSTADLSSEYLSDALAELADGAVPIYTHDLWSAFVDIAAYNVDDDGLCSEDSSMEDRAKVALYVTAQTLLSALVDEVSNDDDEGDDEGDES